MEPLIGPLVLAIALGGGIAYGVWHRRRWLEGCWPLDDVENASTWWSTGLRTKEPLRAAQIVAVGGGKNNPPRWTITSTSSISRRTSLLVTREGVLGSWREKIGWKDIHVGDDAFDRAYTIRGDEPDVVRGILSTHAARDAIRELFARGDIGQLSIGTRGVSVGAARPDTTPAAARNVLLAVVRALDALEPYANAAPRANLDIAGIGGSSGAPFGVPRG